MVKRLAVLGSLLALAACGGGTTTRTVVVTVTTPITAAPTVPTLPPYTAVANNNDSFGEIMCMANNHVNSCTYNPGTGSWQP